MKSFISQFVKKKIWK